MIDESMDTEQMKQPEQPWEFRAKPAWQRLLIMIGGVLVNFLLAMLIYSMVLFVWGEEFITPKDMTMGMKFNTEAKQYGFKDHDILIGTEKGDFREFDVDVYRETAIAREVRVLRNGKQTTVSLPGNISLIDMLKSEPRFMAPFMPAVVDTVLPGTKAAQWGMRKGDRIYAVNGVKVDSYNELTDVMGRQTDLFMTAQTHQDSLNARYTSIAFAHEGSSKLITVRLSLGNDMKFGFVPKSWASYYTPSHVSYGFFESLPSGIRYGINELKGYVGDMKYLFSSDGARNLGGFGAIGSLFPETWNWHRFWLMTAWLSIVLAFMNILPIPALDGGHVLFLLYEIIFRRKPGEKFLIYAEYVGISLLLLLMVVANLNDILRYFGIMY